MLLGAQVLLSVYAGYFGGGVGIMMMAVWSLLGEVDIKAMSAGRTLLVSAANAVAVLCFARRRPGALAGDRGDAGRRGDRRLFRRGLARRVPAAWLRGFVVAYSAAMTAVFFWRAWS